MNKQSIIISIVLGLVITTGSFFAVFGPSLKNLSKNSTEIPSPSTTTGSTSATSTTGTASSGAGGVSTGYDEDDEEYDDDDYGGSTGSVTTGTSTTGTSGSTTTGGTTTSGSTGGSATPSGYTLTQVGAHGSRSSCWSAINGNVYDLTSWVDSHPGGALTILTICGKDGSPFFNAQHGGKNKPANILAGFKIGVLK